MIAKLDLCPLDNIENQQVVNHDRILTLELPWEYILTIYNRKTRELETVHVERLSLFDHYVVIDEVQYHPVGMLSKQRTAPHIALCIHNVDKRVCSACIRNPDE
jgi:hypothetical protein